MKRNKRLALSDADGFDEPLELAVEETAMRFGLTPEQFVVRCVKDKLVGMGIVWWQSMLEINTPRDSEQP